MRIEIKPEAWTDAHDAEINAAFAGKAKTDTTGGLVKPTEYVRDGVFCRVWCDGKPVLWYVLVGFKHESSSEVEIWMAHGRADFDLVEHVLPLIEEQCKHADAIRITTCRPGLIKKLKRVGYRAESVLLRKRKKNDPTA